MSLKPTVAQTVLAGVGGGVAFIAGTAVTFRLFGGSSRGSEGVLFDPDTQHPKVIAVWKEIEPLPRIIETPIVIFVGMLLFGIAGAFLYRSVAPAWPPSISRRAWRLGLIVWTATVFAEFMGPFNTLHQPLRISVLAWSFWAVCAFAEAFAIVYLLDRVLTRSTEFARCGKTT